MSLYEIHDDVVRAWLGAGSSTERIASLDRLAAALVEQLPLPVPTKIGAVVRTAEDVFVRVSRDGGDTKQWWKLGEYLTRDEQDAQWTETEDIGRITEVLSEGVDL